MPAYPTLRFAALALVAAAACGGGRGKADAAITGADSALGLAAQDAGKVYPLEFERMAGTIAAARDTLAKGDPAAAEAMVGTIRATVDSLAGQAPARRTQLAAELDTLRFAVQQNLAAIQAKVDQFLRTGKLPKGGDLTKIGAVKDVLAKTPGEWAQIEADIKNGDLATAFGKGTELRLKISDALGAVGLTAGEAAWHNLTLPPQS